MVNALRQLIRFFSDEILRAIDGHLPQECRVTTEIQHRERVGEDFTM
ncbi:MAG: hypothetical protein LCH36_07285 [Actinobacteria bacterium]|nr:hypothetical protein [Actinomycetota bacterium]